jgi:hypothetical protein
VAYKGFHHHHWTHRCYSHRWHCWMWLCPSTSVWYYWSGERDLYLPVRYLTVVAPTQVMEPTAAEFPPEGREIPEVPEAEVLDIPEP